MMPSTPASSVFWYSTRTFGFASCRPQFKSTLPSALPMMEIDSGSLKENSFFPSGVSTANLKPVLPFAGHTNSVSVPDTASNLRKASAPTVVDKEVGAGDGVGSGGGVGDRRMTGG